MANTENEIRDLFAKNNVPISQKDVWSVQGTPVVKHKALERLAAALRIRYAAPVILRAERDEAVILVTGSIADLHEWSIGEAAVNVNYKVTGKMAAYVYAMAEKRAKDRVILKLAGLHGVYSEEEADEFKEQAVAVPMKNKEEDKIEKFRAGVHDTLRAIGTAKGLETYWADIKKVVPASARDEIIEAFKMRRAEIESITSEAAE